MSVIACLHKNNFISPIQIRNHLMIFQTLSAVNNQYQLRRNVKDIHTLLMEFLDSNLAALQALKLFLPFGLVILQVSIHCSEKMKAT